MSSSIHEENKQLRRRLKAYLTNAQKNEQKLHHFQQHELRFISADGLKELIEAIFVDYRQDFQLDAITLMIGDPEYEIRRILKNFKVTTDSFPDLLFTDNIDDIAWLFNKNYTPILGTFDAHCHTFLFPHYRNQPASIAIFPLIRNKRLIGTLNIGSLQQQRYIKGTATDFLERMAAIVAVCLENGINHEKIKLLGLIDPLTGIHNRRYFDQRLNEEVDRSQRQNMPLSCLFIDIDHFKQFNDVHGHYIGDLVLQNVASLIKGQMRMSDILCRYGGEEFAVVLSQTDKTEALEIAERIRETVAAHKPNLAGNSRLDVTVSIGCSVLDQTLSALDISDISRQLLNMADKALYESKESGRNRVTFAALQAHEERYSSASMDA